MYKVKNLPANYMIYPYAIYTVIRDCGDDGYWYYGSYEDITTAHKAANEIGNGLIIETSKISC